MTSKTIHVVDGRSRIYVWSSTRATRPIVVPRLPRQSRLRCCHVWCSTAHAGHGKWRHGCRRCGALAR